MPSFSAVIWILPRCQNSDLLVHIPTRRFHSVSLDWAGCRPLVHNKWKTKKRTQRTVFKFIRSICHSFNRWELNYKSRLEFKVHVKRNKDVLRHKALKARPTKYREAKTSILSSCNFQPHFQTVKWWTVTVYDQSFMTTAFVSTGPSTSVFLNCN